MYCINWNNVLLVRCSYSIELQYWSCIFCFLFVQLWMRTACLKCMMYSNSGSWSQSYESTWNPKSSSLGYNQRKRNGMTLPRLRLKGCEHFTSQTLTSSFLSRATIWSHVSLVWLCIIWMYLKRQHPPAPPSTLNPQMEVAIKCRYTGAGCNLKIMSARGGAPQVRVRFNKPLYTALHRKHYSITLNHSPLD